MNNKFPITKPIHPKFIIQHIVSSAVRNIYGINWEPRVVRQAKRTIEASRLGSIDYAVPCFELAKEIELPVDQITKELVEFLTKNVSQDSSSDYFRHFSFDAVGGYLNIELTQDYIQIVADNAVNWFAQPHLLYRAEKIKLLTLGYDNSLIDNPVCYSAILTLTRLMKIFQTDHHVSYLFSDLSESVLPGLADKLLLTNGDYKDISPRMKMQTQRVIKNLIANVDMVNKDLPLTREQLFNSIIPQSGDHGGDFIDTSIVSVVKESSLTDLTQKFLDEVIKNTPLISKLIYDDANRAVYYSNGDLIIPLRSFEGYLYNSAYILFEIYNHYVIEADEANFVFISPHKKISIINEFIKSFKAERANTIHFDPNISKLDLIEFNGAVEDIEEFFMLLSKKVELMKKSSTDSIQRHQLLLLVDFPIDISSALVKLQLPALFDMLNQATSDV